MAANPFDQFDPAPQGANPFDQFDPKSTLPPAPPVVQPKPAAPNWGGAAESVSGPLGVGMLGGALNVWRSVVDQPAAWLAKHVGETTLGGLLPTAAQANAPRAALSQKLNNEASGSLAGTAGEMLGEGVAAAPLVGGVGGLAAKALGAVPEVGAPLAKFLSGQVASKAYLPGLAARTANGVLTGGAYGAATNASNDQSLGENVGLGAAVGGVVPAAGDVVQGAGRLLGVVKRAPANVLSSDDLQAVAKQGYKTAKESGVVVTPGSLSNAVGGIQAQLDELGIDPDLQPKVTRVMSRMKSEVADAQQGGTGLSLDQIDRLRRVARTVLKSPDPSEQMFAGRVIDGIDDYVEGLQSGDLMTAMDTNLDPTRSVQALQTARQAWKQASKADQIQQLIDNASLIGPSKFTQSGEENALRQQFRQLALNPRKMGKFTQEEQDAIRKVAMGTFGGNMLRQLGKLSPVGALPIGAELITSLTHPGAAFGMAAGGAAARQAATTMTEGNAANARDLMLGGRGWKPTVVPYTTPKAAVPAAALTLQQLQARMRGGQ